MLDVKVFAKNSKSAQLAAQGIDPSDIASEISKRLPKGEQAPVRNSLENALRVLQDRTVPNMTDIQLDIAGRRIRARIS